MNKPPKAIFATLTSDSQKALLEKVKPIYKKIYTHHVTIFYAPKEENVKSLLDIIVPGQDVIIKLGRRFWANGVEAIEAKVFTKDGKEVPINNKKPHVTISTDNKPPVLSNDMLEQKGDFNSGFEGAQLIGGEWPAKIEFVDKF